jgi:hypothetical protein
MRSLLHEILEISSVFQLSKNQAPTTYTLEPHLGKLRLVNDYPHRAQRIYGATQWQFPRGKAEGQNCHLLIAEKIGRFLCIAPSRMGGNALVT